MLTENKTLKIKIMRNEELDQEEINEVLNWFEPFELCTFPEMGDRQPKLFDYGAEPVKFYEFISGIGGADKRGLYISKFGWIEPNGNYYSCDFSWHEFKAQAIVICNRELSREFISNFNNVVSGVKALTRMNQELTPSDFLLNKGWCRLQSIQGGDPFAVLSEIRELTKKQIDTLYDITFKFRLETDPITKKELSWNKI